MTLQRFPGLTLCLSLFLAMATSAAAAATRPLDLTPCAASFETYQQTSLVNSRLRLATEQAYRTPRAQKIEKLEEEIAEAESLSADDFIASRFGSGNAPPQERMHAFVQGLSLAEARERRKEDNAMLDALQAGDYDRYEAIKGTRPDNPIEEAYLRAMSEADLCTWNARITQLTGKAAPAAKVPATAVQGSGMSAQECATRQEQVSSISLPDNASITDSQETVMFMTRSIVDMIDGGCPGGTPEQRRAERDLRQQQYAAAEQACNAVQSGGRHCVAHNHFKPGAVAATAAPAVPKPQPQPESASKAYKCTVDPKSGTTSIPEIPGSPPDLVAYDPVTGQGWCEPGAGARNAAAHKAKSSGTSSAPSSDWETSSGIRH
jgi:hypothetical protein